MTNILMRSLKIDLLLDNPNAIIDSFNDMWDNLYIAESNVYHERGGEIIYYIISDSGRKQWVFYRDDSAEIFWCNQKHYGKVIKVDQVYQVYSITNLLVSDFINRNIISYSINLGSLDERINKSLGFNTSNIKAQRYHTEI